MTSSAQMIMKGRCQDYRFKLTKDAEELIDKFLKIGQKYLAKNNSWLSIYRQEPYWIIIYTKEG